MSAPTVGPATQDVYDGLPELYRTADAAQPDGPSGYPLLRYLALVLDQLTTPLTITNRIAFTPLDERADLPSDEPFGLPAPWERYGTGTYGDGTYGDVDTSDLTDPATADAGWLTWLAQLLGVPATGLTPTELRTALMHPETSWAHGTVDAIRREVRKNFNADAYVDVIANYDGDPFTIAVVTTTAETAGTTTWGDLEAETGGTWNGIENLGSWNAAETATLNLATNPERPAGYRLVHRYLEDL